MDILEQLRRDEGCVLHAYLDSRGYWTIGDGFLIDPRKGAKPPAEMTWPDGQNNITVHCTITQDVADRLLQEQVSQKRAQLDALLPWWKGLDDARQGVLLNMAYNLGATGLVAFHRTLSLIEEGQYAEAADHVLRLPWALEVGHRAERLSQQLRTGEWV